MAAELYLMSRDHHFEDVVSGSVGNASPGQQRGHVMGQGVADMCDANCEANCDSARVRI